CGSGGDGHTAYYINTGETIQYRHDPENPHSLSDNFIGPVIRSNNGTLWVGTLNKGLDYFVPGEDNVQNIRFQQGSENGLSGNSISSLALTNDNMLYIGTEAGVDILQTDSMIVRPFEFNHQLPSTNIRSIVVDKAENIWIATRTGLMKYKPQKQDYQIFYKSDGLVSSNFLPGSAHQSELGEIVLGTEKGLVSFFPWDIERNQKPPLVYITGVLANQVNMTESLSGITNNSENEPRLDHTKNNITFHVAALDFHDPQKNQILYKLEGFENRWKQVGETNTVQYNNLPPGNYTFNVKGANNDNVWNNHGARYSFQISPPYWDTLWFKTVVFMGIILAIFSFIWLQLRKVAGQKKELERLVAFRTAELNEQKQKVEKKNLSLENQKQAIEHQAMLLSQTNQKLEEQKIAIEKQAQELKEMDRIKSGFFANISHEFRTPLTLILNALSLYKEEHRVSSGNDPSDGLKISVIQKNAQRLQRLINQILDVIKIESGFMKLRVAEGNIEEFILAITSLFKLKAEAEKIRLITDIDLHQQIGYMDWDKLEKIIFNLVANAIKFTSSNGTVVVRVTDKLSDSCRNKLQIQVRDNGSGIPFELQERVFSMFFHSETTKNDNRSGTGIGLALAKQLSQIHKGDITLISEPGNGSTFTLQLPRDKRDFSAEEIGNTEISTIKKQHYTDILPSPQEKFMDNSVENHTKPRLLFVDDNKELCYLIREQLKSDFYVEVAFDAIQGLEKSINTYPDIIVSDLMMPKISGIEFCKRVKQDIRTEHLPFILLTARIDEKSEIEALALNADDYITKPYSIEILRLKLRNQMEIREKLESKLRNELQSPEIQKKQGYSNRFMKNASEIIIQNIDNPEFNVDNLATGLNMSRTQLYRKSEKLLGMSANNFIKRVKLNHAWELLEDGEYNISEVAYRVGFKTPGYFSKCFEEQFGVLPSRYIAENSK
ncbi:MAG: ATP-binding protein, partial [Bacteroidales bacterium]